MPKKVDQYENERREILIRLFNILEITKENNTITLNDIDNDNNKLMAIEELDYDIKKYFLTSRWGCYRRDNLKRKYYSVLQSILKQFNIKYKQYTDIIKIIEKDDIIIRKVSRVIINL